MAEAVTLADPIPAPLTCGCVAGVVAPAAMETLAGAVTLVVSLLARFTVKPPAGAGADRVTVNALDWPKPSVVRAGTLIDRETCTVTLAVAFAMPAALAVIVTGPPAATPVTVTGTLAAPAAKFTVAGTVVTPVLLEFRLTVKPPADAGVDKFSVRVPVEPALIVRGDPVKLIVGAPFCTKKFRLPIPPLWFALSVATQSMLWMPLDSLVVSRGKYPTPPLLFLRPGNKVAMSERKLL